MAEPGHGVVHVLVPGTAGLGYGSRPDYGNLEVLDVGSDDHARKSRVRVRTVPDAGTDA